MTLSTPSPTITVALFALVISPCLVLIYRLYWSPLAKFPGPRLAAATGLYEKYFDLISGPRFSSKIAELHEKYGPIIRITPTQLHISDPSYAPVHFSTREKRNRFSGHQYIMGLPESGLFATDHDLHRLRRSALNSMFSRRSITAFEPHVSRTVDAMCDRVESFRGTQQPLNLRRLFLCFATDIVTEYAFGRCQNLLSSDDLGTKWRALLDAWVLHCHWFKHFPLLWKTMHRIPPGWITALAPDMHLVLDLEERNRQQIKEVMRDEFKDASHPIVFQEVLRSGLPDVEKEPERLFQEGQSVLGAGSETVSATLTHLVFYILDTPGCWARIKAEVTPLMPDQDSAVPSWLALEQLPYLTAVIQEGLRFSAGISVRACRVAPKQTLHYNGWDIPAGTCVGMSLMGLNMDPVKFPEPEKFVPERWMDLKGPLPEMYSFSKGTRMCVGVNLAYAELYKALAAIIRRFDLELYDTGIDGVHPYWDAFVPMPKTYAKGVRVVVK